jgi:hypothetical protein
VPHIDGLENKDSRLNGVAAINVLERIDGVRIDDYAGIERMGFDRKDIALKGAGALLINQYGVATQLGLDLLQGPEIAAYRCRAVLN